MLNAIKNPKIKNTTESIGRFLRGRERMLHVSALIVDHPMFVHAVQQGAAGTYQGPRYMVGSTRTHSRGSNQRKRLRYSAALRIAGSMRSARRKVSQLRATDHA